MSLFKYLANRLGTYLLVLFIGITIIFILPRLMPGDPIDDYLARIEAQAGQALTAEEVLDITKSLAELYGLEGSLLSQYFGYLKRLFITFDFGPSYSAFPIPVSEFIRRALPWTLGLLATTTVLSWIIGNAIGVFAGFFHNKRTSTVLEVIGVLLYPIPYYISALTLIIVFAYIWPVFPLVTTLRPGPVTVQKIGNIIYNSMLPGLTIVLAQFGWSILSMKALAYATREEGFVVYATLKGVRDRTIMLNYVFRNAILPQITALAMSMGRIFSGALLTEMLFSYPGIGMLMRNAVSSGDYNMLYGTISVSIIAVATATLVIDLLYPLFDPRIRYR
jgi:peptide/nickel transport system permease protein